MLISSASARAAWVLDTNVVLDWLIFEDASMSEAAQWLRSGRVTWLATDAMRQEAMEVATRPFLAKIGPAAELQTTVANAFASHATMVLPPAVALLKCSDPDDQIFLDLALAHRTQLLLTRDRALLELAPKARTAGLRIARPQDLQLPD